MNINNEIKYDAWLNWSLTELCQLNCEYCFSNQNFLNKPCLRFLNKIKKRVDKVEPIDAIKASKVLADTGLIYVIGIVGGGEPFLVPNIVELCVELSQIHYLTVVSNFVSPSVRHFIDTIPPEKVTSIVASLHIEELETMSLTDVFINNVRLAKEKGFRIAVHTTCYPPVINSIEDYKKIFNSMGVRFEVRPYIGKYKNKNYPAAYTEEDNKQFTFRNDLISAVDSKARLCNAGCNVAYVDPGGVVYPCTSTKNSIGNIFKKIEFRNIMMKCPVKICGCPWPEYDNTLFLKALAKTQKSKK